MEQRQYFGCHVLQRKNVESSIPFFVFYARVQDVRSWCGIKRTQDFREGTQRILRPSRSRAVTRFFERGNINTIPNNILLAFEPGVVKFTSFKNELIKCIPGTHIDNDCDDQLDWGVIDFEFEANQPEHLRPALIVDGQHRIDGMANFMQENLPILIVALINTPLQEQAFQFIVINSKSVKVSTDNAKSIIASLTREAERELEKRLMEAGVSYADKSAILKDINDFDISPFKNMLDWEYNRVAKKEKGIILVPITAIETCLRYIRDQFDFMNFDDDEDTLVEIFCAIWRAVKDRFPDLWGKDNVFMTKVNITALNEFITDRLKSAWVDDVLDALDPDSFEKQTSNYLKQLDEDFWKSEWTVKIQDNANVRNRIKDDLWSMTTNSKRQVVWHKGLRLPTEAD